MNILKLYQEQIKQEKIKNFVPEGSNNIESSELSFRERQHYTYNPGYKVKYHFGEIFNRIICVEYNKPKEREINRIKAKLNGATRWKIIKCSCTKMLTTNSRKPKIFCWFCWGKIESSYLINMVS